MRILHTPARFFPYIGGVENTVYNMSKGLVAAGHSVRVICADEPHATSSGIEGVDVVRLGYAGKVANTNITPGLFSRIMRDDFDIIHTHLPCPWSADISCLASKLKKKPLFLNYHNEITGSGFNKYIASCYNRFLLGSLLSRATRIFVSHKNHIDSSVFLKPWVDKIRVVPFGVDLSKFKPLTRAEVNEFGSIFFLSKLDKFHAYKGLTYLLKAIRIVRSRQPVKLYIGGDGELSGYYKKMAVDLGIKDCVVFLGLLSDEQLTRCYNDSDAFVLPSVSGIQEGWGLVAVEAMACAKPVITTAIVGMAQDIKAANAGVIVDKEDVDGLASAIGFMVSNPDQCREMGQNALRLAREKFSWKGYVSVLIEEYEKSLK